jgi:hypothetical protein
VSREIHALSVVADSRTVAAVGPDRTFAYSDADWLKIKQSLKWHSGIDADAVTIGDRWWARSDPTTAITAAPRRQLREQLEALASDYHALSRWRREGHSLTPKQEAAKIQKVLNAFKRARPAIDSLMYIRETMNVFIARLERHRNKLLALGNRSSANARKVHIEYWGELVVLRRAIAAGKNPQGVPLNHFLYVCSLPVFPETTRGRIRSFINQLH